MDLREFSLQNDKLRAVCRALIRGRNVGVFLYRYCHNGSEAHESGSSFLLNIKSDRKQVSYILCQG